MDDETADMLLGPGAILALKGVANTRGLIRNCQLDRMGVKPCHRIAAEQLGSIIRVSRGIYTGPETTEWQRSNLAQLAVKHRRVTFALNTALMLWGMAEWDLSAPLWAATGTRSRLPKLPFAVNWLRWSPRRHDEGVYLTGQEGIDMNATSPARTVADFFAHRRRLEPNAPERALEVFRASKDWSEADLLSAARLCRVLKPVEAALEQR